MKLSKRCEDCIYSKQKELIDDEDYLNEIKEIIYKHRENDSSSYLVYRCNQVYARRFGKPQRSYTEIKKRFNDLVLSIEDDLRIKIEESRDPLASAMVYARIGNYIDFSALYDVKEKDFLALFDKAEYTEKDRKTMDAFKKQCAKARTFLLIADNCGEIVIDKLFLEQLLKLYLQFLRIGCFRNIRMVIGYNDPLGQGIAEAFDQDMFLISEDIA